MKIATWNVERLKHRKSLSEIITVCERSQADILILTENDEAIKPEYRNCRHTPTPPPIRQMTDLRTVQAVVIKLEVSTSPVPAAKA